MIDVDNACHWNLSRYQAKIIPMARFQMLLLTSVCTANLVSFDFKMKGNRRCVLICDTFVYFDIDFQPDNNLTAHTPSCGCARDQSITLLVTSFEDPECTSLARNFGYITSSFMTQRFYPRFLACLTNCQRQHQHNCMHSFLQYRLPLWRLLFLQESRNCDKNSRTV